MRRASRWSAGRRRRRRRSGTASLDVVGDATALAAGRRLIVKGLRHDNGQPIVHETTLVSASAGPGGSTVLAIDPQLPALLRRASVVVFGNVAHATHGETVAEVLGNGDAGRPHQRFELKRLPLTYRSAINEIGADSQLSVRVGDVEWQELPTLFESRPDDRVYTLRTDEQGKWWVVFGDGVRGARLPSGVNNVRARYRQGLGRDGNVDAEQLTQLKTRPLGLKSVANPLPAQGGSDAEPADQARRSMPLGTRTLGRAVSLLDYEDFALAFAGVAKAQARVLQLRGGPTIAITLAGQDGASIASGNPIWEGLDGALKDNGDPHVRIALLPYQASTFRIGLKVKRDPAYELDAVLAAVEAALRAQYGFDRRALGEPVQQST
jgi:predicted phage baseplate assembly protein